MLHLFLKKKKKKNILTITDMHTLELGVFMYIFYINDLPVAFNSYIKKSFDIHDYPARQVNNLTLSLNRSSPKGFATTPLTVFALVLKIAQPRGKIAPGTFKFILSLHFTETFSNLPPTLGVG